MIVPCKIWHGERDNGTTPAMARHLSKGMCCELELVPDRGHMLYFERFFEVLEWLREGAPV